MSINKSTFCSNALNYKKISDGIIKKYNIYNRKGELVGYNESEVKNDGKIKIKKLFSSDGKLVSYTVNETKENGNIVEKHIEVGRYSEIYEFSNNYERILSRKKYNEFNDLIESTIYEYDNHLNLIKDTHYNLENDSHAYTIYEYKKFN